MPTNTSRKTYDKLIKTLMEGGTRGEVEKAQLELQRRGFTEPDNPIIREYEEVFPPEQDQKNSCYQCGSLLNQERECPRNCTVTTGFYYGLGFLQEVA